MEEKTPRLAECETVLDLIHRLYAPRTLVPDPYLVSSEVAISLQSKGIPCPDDQWHDPVLVQPCFLLRNGAT